MAKGGVIAVEFQGVYRDSAKKQESDVTEVITSPSQFHSVGQYYKEFNPVSDEQVIKILQDRTRSAGI